MTRSWIDEIVNVDMVNVCSSISTNWWLWFQRPVSNARFSRSLDRFCVVNFHIVWRSIEVWVENMTMTRSFLTNFEWSDNLATHTHTRTHTHMGGSRVDRYHGTWSGARSLFKIGGQWRTKPYPMIFLLLLFWEGRFFYDWLPILDHVLPTRRTSYIEQPSAILYNPEHTLWKRNEQWSYLVSVVRLPFWTVEHSSQCMGNGHGAVDVVNVICEWPKYEHGTRACMWQMRQQMCILHYLYSQWKGKNPRCT